MIKLVLLVLLLLGFSAFRRSALWKNLVSDPKIQKGLMIVGGIASWTVIGLVIYAAIETSLSLFSILKSRSVSAGYSLISLAFILSGIALGIQYVIAFGNPKTLGDFRTLFYRLLLFQVTERETMNLEEELEKLKMKKIEEQVRKEYPPSEEKDHDTMDHFGIP